MTLLNKFAVPKTVAIVSTLLLIGFLFLSFGNIEWLCAAITAVCLLVPFCRLLKPLLQSGQLTALLGLLLLLAVLALALPAALIFTLLSAVLVFHALPNAIIFGLSYSLALPLKNRWLKWSAILLASLLLTFNVRIIGVCQDLFAPNEAFYPAEPLEIGAQDSLEVRSNFSEITYLTEPGYNIEPQNYDSPLMRLVGGKREQSEPTQPSWRLPASTTLKLITSLHTIRDLTFGFDGRPARYRLSFNSTRLGGRVVTDFTAYADQRIIASQRRTLRVSYGQELSKDALKRTENLQARLSWLTQYSIWNWLFNEILTARNTGELRRQDLISDFVLRSFSANSIGPQKVELQLDTISEVQEENSGAIPGADAAKLGCRLESDRGPTTVTIVDQGVVFSTPMSWRLNSFQQGDESAQLFCNGRDVYLISLIPREDNWNRALINITTYAPSGLPVAFYQATLPNTPSIDRTRPTVLGLRASPPRFELDLSLASIKSGERIPGAAPVQRLILNSKDRPAGNTTHD